MKIRVLVERSRETGNYLAHCPEVVGCAAVANSRDEAIRRVRELVARYMGAADAHVPAGVETAEVEL